MVSDVHQIRLATPRDAPTLLEIYSPFVTDAAVSFELTPPTAAEFAQRVTSTLERTPWLVCEVGGRVTGYAYASRHRERAAYQWSVEVSAYVRQEGRRRGAARALYEKLFEILALQGFFNAFAAITLPNDASVAFHLALGFQQVGVYHSIGFKAGRWHDVAWFERPLRAHEAPTDPPVPLSYIPCSAVEAVLSANP